jgi:ribosomal protein S18 acetylase RimI-like enzyme
MSTSQKSLPSVCISLATPTDVLAAIPVVNAAFALENFFDGTRTDDTRITEMMKTGEFLVAKNESGHIVASVYTECHDERGYIGMLAVEPSLQGLGLGRKMLTSAEEHCRGRGCEHVDIKVLSLRAELVPFYRRLGYAETGTEEFHPSRPLKPGVMCHCIIMSKSL